MHSASGITADASISGSGDSTDHGDEKSAVKNTDPDSRTTRRTSDNTSMCDLLRRVAMRGRLQPEAQSRIPEAESTVKLIRCSGQVAQSLGHRTAPTAG